MFAKMIMESAYIFEVSEGEWISNLVFEIFCYFLSFSYMYDSCLLY